MMDEIPAKKDRVSVSLPVWLGHHAATSYLAVAALTVLAGVMIGGHARGFYLIVTFILTILVRIACVHHGRSDCAICAAVNTRIGPEAAEHHSRDLRRYHTGGKYRWLVPILLFAPLDFLFAIPPETEWLAWAIVYLGLGLNQRAISFHLILFPWCQHCNDYGWR
jgi:hypothetical protein